jgi:hypothetical protein
VERKMRSTSRPEALRHRPVVDRGAQRLPKRVFASVHCRPSASAAQTTTMKRR